jgi:hypothetical protein
MPGVSELADVGLYNARPMAGAELILLKFRDLNSSASVMLGDGICVCGCLGGFEYGM